MLRGGWSKQLKARPTAIFAATLAVIAVIGWGHSETAEYEREADNRAAEYAKHTYDKIGYACVRVPSVDKADCVEQAYQERRANERDEQDLVAQKTSALWAYIMGAAAVVGMALSAVGVFLVWTTFRATKAGNRIAERNVEAALEQVKIAQDTAARQLRAYLSFKPVEMDEITVDRNPLEIRFTVENTGATPANEWVVVWAWQVTEEEPTTDFYEKWMPSLPEIGPDHCIGPKQIKTIPLTIEIGECWRSRVVSGTHKFFVFGAMIYVDFSGERHRTDFFYVYNPRLENRLGQASVKNRIG
jgi:hypothetical protein